MVDQRTALETREKPNYHSGNVQGHGGWDMKRETGANSLVYTVHTCGADLLELTAARPRRSTLEMADLEDTSQCQFLWQRAVGRVREMTAFP